MHTDEGSQVKEMDVWKWLHSDFIVRMFVHTEAKAKQNSFPVTFLLHTTSCSSTVSIPGGSRGLCEVCRFSGTDTLVRGIHIIFILHAIKQTDWAFFKIKILW